MKILRVVPTMDPKMGGVCQAIRSSIPALEQRGVTSQVVSFDDPNEAYLKNDQFVIHALGPAKGPYAYCPRLYQWMQESLGRFDVVVIDGLWQHHSYGTVRALKSFRQKNLTAPRLLVMPHGMLDPYFQTARSRRLKAVRNYLFWKGIEFRVIEAADGLLFTCRTELELARQPFRPYRPRKEWSIGFGIQPPPAYTQHQKEAFFSACPAVEGKPYILFLGRIDPKKGVDLLIDSYRRLKEEDPALPDLVIAGPGKDSEYGKQISHPPTPGVHYPGMLQGDAKWGAFYNCESFVLPSHQENFGIAVVEALACSKPVLISNQVNIFKEIVAANAGISAEDTLAGTYELLKGWTNLNKQQKQDMQYHARRVYEQHFTIDSAADRMLEVCRDIIRTKTHSQTTAYEISTENF